MEELIQNRLLTINRVFYERFADSFSTTRHQAQPGVRELVDRMITAESILDVGCGNGTLARALAAKGYQGLYIGGDLSQDLLDKAEELLPKRKQGRFDFFPIDLAEPGWQQALPEGSFSWLVSFAVLHHIPGRELRQHTIDIFASLIAKEGRIAVSVWQWQNSPRLKKRIIPWSTLRLREEDLDPGDVLLDWRAGETTGLRYVHTFNEEELRILAENAGFKVIENFYADGKQGNLALYQIWQLA
jgi:SAM-dependent methyltransferase